MRFNGAPGVHSARFAAVDSAKSGNTPDADNNAKLLRLLKNIPRKNARRDFVASSLSLRFRMSKPKTRLPVCYEEELKSLTFDGACEGKIIFAPRGEKRLRLRPAVRARWFRANFRGTGRRNEKQIEPSRQGAGKT
jgi:inosine/xanthosine triphosphate pyrophosphatase family protein